MQGLKNQLFWYIQTANSTSRGKTSIWDKAEDKHIQQYSATQWHQGIQNYSTQFIWTLDFGSAQVL